MRLKGHLDWSKIAWGQFLPAFVLVVNSFTWYSLTNAVFVEKVSNLPFASTDILLLFAIFYAGIALSAILGSMFFRGGRRTFFSIWISTGIVASILLNFIEASPYGTTLFISLFLGVSIGLGLPSCLAYFADSTIIENRGFLGGISYGVSGLGILSLAYLLSGLSSSAGISILTIWRGLGLLIFVLLVWNGKEQQEQSTPSYSSILGKRTIILYLLPWVMFCLVNWTETPLLEKLFGDFYSFVVFVEFGTSGIVAFVAGVFADLVGRKRLVIAGFVMLGIEYAALSLVSEIQTYWYLFVILDGVSWGMFSVVFFMVLWGDLAEKARKEKYYVIGGLPYLLAGFLSIVVKPYIEVINPTTAFSLASFFLFLAVLPLMYAPESLPERKIKERELRQYIEKAKRAKEKYA